MLREKETVNDETNLLNYQRNNGLKYYYMRKLVLLWTCMHLQWPVFRWCKIEIMKQLLGHIIKRFAYIYCPSLTHTFPISGIGGHNVIHALFCDNVFEYHLRCFRTHPEVSYWPCCEPDSFCHRIRYIVTD